MLYAGPFLDFLESWVQQQLAAYICGHYYTEEEEDCDQEDCFAQYCEEGEDWDQENCCALYDELPPLDREPHLYWQGTEELWDDFWF